jgi:hypothetical protein
LQNRVIRETLIFELFPSDPLDLIAHIGDPALPTVARKIGQCSAPSYDVGSPFA